MLILWKEYNYHRFGKLRRRKFKPDVRNEEVDEYFSLKDDIRNALRNDKYIILYENPIPEGIGQGRNQKKGKIDKEKSTRSE